MRISNAVHEIMDRNQICFNTEKDKKIFDQPGTASSKLPDPMQEELLKMIEVFAFPIGRGAKVN